MNTKSIFPFPGAGSAFAALLMTLSSAHAALDNAAIDTDFRSAVSKGRLAGIQADGKVFVYTAEIEPGLTNRIIRLNTDGSEDTTFSPVITRDPVVLGASTVEFPAILRTVIPMPDGTVAVQGVFSKVNGTPVRPLFRLKTDGALDEPFDPLAGEPNLFPLAAAAGPEGSLWIIGVDSSIPVPQRTLLLRKYRSDGTTDPTIKNGLEGYPSTGGVFVSSLRDGGLLVGDLRAPATGTQVALVRLQPDGALRPGFLPPAKDFAAAYLFDEFPDGGLLVGWHAFSGEVATGVRRLLPDGKEDVQWQANYNATARDEVGFDPNNLGAIAALPDGSSLVLTDNSIDAIVLGKTGARQPSLKLGNVGVDDPKNLLNPGKIVWGIDGRSFYTDAFNLWPDGSRRAVSRIKFDPPPAPTAPEIVEQPRSVAVHEGAPLELKAGVTGSPPLRFQWLLNGAPVTGASVNPYATTARAEDAGDWTVIVENASGSATSRVAVVSVALAARILAGLAPTTIDAGQPLRLQVTARGDEPLRFAWKKDGQVLPDAAGPVLEISSARVSDSGFYEVEVSNLVGRASSSAVVTVTGTTPPPANLTLRSIGAWDHPDGIAERVEVDGMLAYLTLGEGGFVILGLQPGGGRPILVSSFDTPGHARGVDVANRHAFVADGPAGLQVIDVSRPTRPVLAGGLDLRGVAMDVQVSGNVAYVADSSLGIVAVDISQPANPREIARSPAPASAAIVRIVEGDGIYFGNSVDGLSVKTFETVATAAFRGRYDPEGRTFSAVGLHVTADRIYFASADSGVVVLRKSTEPVVELPVLGTFEPMGEVLAIQADGLLVYLADPDNGVRVFDASNPASFKPLASFQPEAGVSDIRLGGDLVYLARGRGLEVLRVSASEAVTPPTLTISRNPDGTYTIGGAAADKFRLEFKERLSDPAWSVWQFQPNQPFSWPVGGEQGFLRAISR